MPIEFDLGWSHSFRNAVNWDAAWVFVKFRLGAEPWRHATLSSQEEHVSIRDDNGVTAEVVVTADGMGAFVFLTAPGTGPVDWDGVGVFWNYAADGVPNGAPVSVHVSAIDVVRVPTGPFVLGDAEGGNVRGHFRGATSALTFAVTGEEAITLGGSSPGRLDSNDSYGMAAPFTDDFNESVSVELPARFPKGYAGFYIMKYELTEGLYAAFLNTLDERQQQARNPAYDLTTGGPGPCWSCLGGPLRVGAFAAAGATREEAGSSYYGVLDLSGNLVERVVTVANSAGRRFDGRHGNGSIGANGNASGLEVARWPGTTATGAQSQIIGALGSGQRGGGWTTPAANLRISDREYAATTDNTRDPAFGYRFVRTAPAHLTLESEPTDGRQVSGAAGGSSPDIRNPTPIFHSVPSPSRLLRAAVLLFPPHSSRRRYNRVPRPVHMLLSRLQLADDETDCVLSPQPCLRQIERAAVV